MKILVLLLIWKMTVDISNESPVISDTINVSMIISKVRQIEIFFRKSSLKN